MDHSLAATMREGGVIAGEAAEESMSTHSSDSGGTQRTDWRAQCNDSVVVPAGRRNLAAAQRGVASQLDNGGDATSKDHETMAGLPKKQLTGSGDPREWNLIQESVPREFGKRNKIFTSLRAHLRRELEDGRYPFPVMNDDVHADLLRP